MPDLQAGQEPEGTETPTPEQQTEAAAAAAPEAANAETPAGDPAGTEEPAGDPAGTEGAQTPDWKAKQEASANREAAKYRVQLREAQTQLEEREKTITELRTENEALKGKATQATRASIAAAYGLPEPLAKVLSGESEEELRAHAETLAQFAGGPQRTTFRTADGVGGLDPFEGGETTDVSSAVAAARSLRY